MSGDRRDESATLHPAGDTTPRRAELTNTVRAAIVTYNKLSPKMREAVRGAARPTPKGALAVGGTGHVAWRTKNALAQRDIMLLSDNTLTDFGRIVHAVAVTSAVDVLAWAENRDAEVIARMNRDLAKLPSGKYVNTEISEQLAAYDAFDWRTVGQPIDHTAERETLPTPVCTKDGHEARPAVAALVYIGQSEDLDVYLCRECVTCSGDCDELGDVMDSEYEEPWCQRHADAFDSSYSPDERVTGPDIMPLDSDRYRTLITENTERKAAEGRGLARRTIRQGMTVRQLGELLDTHGRTRPRVRAFREVVMDELHARAVESGQHMYNEHNKT